MNRLTLIIVLGLAASGGVACRAGGHAPAEPARASIAVTLAPAIAVAAAERLEAGGTIAARETAVVSSRIVATIAAVPVKAGDRVRQGDILVTLDANDAIEHAQQARAAALAAEKAVLQARSAHRAAEAEHQLASSWHQRITTLHARASATDHERDEAGARLASSAAHVAAAQSAVELADASLAAARSAAGAAAAAGSYATLRAPFDGQVIERLTDPGNLAAPGVPLLRIESGGARQAVVRVDEARAAYVHPGDRVDVEIDDPGDEAGVHQGTVAEVARAIGEDQRAFTVKVDLPGTVTARSGTFARAVFRGRPRKAVLVPASAIRRKGQVASVFVVQDGVARLRLVQAGPALTDGVEILAGVDAGESVVTAPLSGVTDGARVTPGFAASPAGVRR